MGPACGLDQEEFGFEEYPQQKPQDHSEDESRQKALGFQLFTSLEKEKSEGGCARGYAVLFSVPARSRNQYWASLL